MRMSKEGFTLIELLLVMGLIAILSTIVLISINPTELLSRSNDAGRISAVLQLGHYLQSYYTSKNGVYPSQSAWDEELAVVNGFGSFPAGIAYISNNGILPCTTNVRPDVNPTYCYLVDESENQYGAIIFAKLESKNKRDKCIVAGEFPYFVYSSSEGRAGIICSPSDPVPWQAGTQTYID
jgi:prepilin-type N-terminal cleavage/methylation domain-containing protein